MKDRELYEAIKAKNLQIKAKRFDFKGFKGSPKLKDAAASLSSGPSTRTLVSRHGTRATKIYKNSTMHNNATAKGTDSPMKKEEMNLKEASVGWQPH